MVSVPLPSPQASQEPDACPARDRAVAAAAALAGGSTAQALQMLAPFRLREDDAVVLLRQLQERPPRGPREPLAWALEELGALGLELEDYGRTSWMSESYHPNGAKDSAAALAWTRFFLGDPWNTRAGWEDAYLGPVTGVFRAVMEARRLPHDVRLRCIEDLREAFFYGMVSGDPIPGWAELAVRVVETTGEGPFAGMLAVADAAVVGRLGWGAAQRGSWRASAAMRWPGASVGTRAVNLIRAFPEDGEALLGFHLAARLVDSWADGEALDRDVSRRILRQNHGRARGRLRAILAEERPPALQSALLSVDALHHRTLSAVRRYAWSWAWQQLSMDFAFDAQRPVTPPCTHAPPSWEPLGDAAMAPLRTWVLLVVLKGRLGHLRRWCYTGGTGDRDSTWARLLAQDLPQCLVDPGPRRAYERLRVTLVDQIGDLLADLLPQLRRVADLPPGRTLRADTEALLLPAWCSEVEFPRSGFPTFVRYAASAASELASERENPCAT